MITQATDVGAVKDPASGRQYTRFKLSPGGAFHLRNGEWTAEKVTPGAVASCQDTDRILMIKGRACVVFTVLGQEQYAQPITGQVSPGVEKAERAAKRRMAAVPESVKPDAQSARTTTKVSAPNKPSKAALKLARMRGRG